MRTFSIRGAALCGVAVFAAVALAGSGSSGRIYDSTPSHLPPSMVSLGFEATSTTEFGDQIAFAGTKRAVKQVTVDMVTWAYHSTYPTMSAAGWQHPITLNLYNVDKTGAVPKPGTIIASVTTTFDIPWRPEPADPTSTDTRWIDSHGVPHNGFAFEIRFTKLDKLHITLPDEIIYGIAYDTADYGVAPIHAAGPYNSLNVGLLTDEPANRAGTDVDADALFVNTTWAGFYTDGGAGGVGIFRRDTGWTGMVPAVKFEAKSVKKSKDDKDDDGDDSHDD